MTDCSVSVRAVGGNVNGPSFGWGRFASTPSFPRWRSVSASHQSLPDCPRTALLHLSAPSRHLGATRAHAGTQRLHVLPWGLRWATILHGSVVEIGARPAFALLSLWLLLWAIVVALAPVSLWVTAPRNGLPEGRTFIAVRKGALTCGFAPRWGVSARSTRRTHSFNPLSRGNVCFPECAVSVPARWRNTQWVCSSRVSLMSNLYASIQQEPPPMGKYGEHGSNGGRPSVWAAALAPLRLKPGAWHRMVRPFPPATASYITNGRAAGIVAGEFEATTRAEVDGVHAPKGKTFLFVRYVGQF